MKGLPKFSPIYFNRYDQHPVKFNPFNPQSTKVAQDYISALKKVLQKPHIHIIHRGSTAFKISGKGDIEIGIYPTQKEWPEILRLLQHQYKKINNLEDDYARFNDTFRNIDIEIILLKGHAATVDQKLHHHLLSHPHLLVEYELLKQKYSYSKREYQKRKDQFFRKVIRQLPN